MALHPMLPPDDSEPRESDRTLAPALKETEYPLAHLTSTLAAHGAGMISADLALDLILNDIVEQACLATGATGAAIALLRGEEMVCRASTGADAPGLGIRLDTRSGLPGTCFQTGNPQLCGDSETDPRVDKEACRVAGIRSILLVPVIESGEVFGIVEVFASRPNAFGELDTITVKALAQQVVENRRQARETAERLEAGVMPAQDVSLEHGNQAMAIEPSTFAEAVPGSQTQAPEHAISEAISTTRVRHASRPADFWTAFLAVIVIGATVLMGTLLVWRMGGGARTEARPPNHPRSTVNQAATGAVSEAAAPAVSVETKQASTLAAENVAPSTPAAPRAERRPVKRAKSPEEEPGGLVVYERGRVIYRMPPSAPVRGTQAAPSGRTNAETVILASKTTLDSTQIAEGAATARLVHRVEPQYPPTAEKQGVQGPVVLDAEISREGKVEKLTVLKGEPQLAAAAVEAVKQWRYEPYIKDGQPIGMRTTITVNFTIPGK
ncbi:MAG TPA: TonB family protein [Terriglobales bacterium]|nr:TonB family protein [Terriglobales bacterium]